MFALQTRGLYHIAPSIARYIATECTLAKQATRLYRIHRANTSPSSKIENVSDLIRSLFLFPAGRLTPILPKHLTRTSHYPLLNLYKYTYCYLITIFYLLTIDKRHLLVYNIRIFEIVYKHTMLARELFSRRKGDQK